MTAGMIDARSSANVTEEDARTDLYRPARTAQEVTDLLEKGVEEFNKIHPRIKLALYKVGRVLAPPTLPRFEDTPFSQSSGLSFPLQ